MLKLLVRKFLPVLFLQSEAGRKLRGKLEGQGKQLLQTAKEKLEYFTFLAKTCPGNIDRWGTRFSSLPEYYHFLIFFANICKKKSSFTHLNINNCCIFKCPWAIPTTYKIDSDLKITQEAGVQQSPQLAISILPQEEKRSSPISNCGLCADPSLEYGNCYPQSAKNFWGP